MNHIIIFLQFFDIFVIFEPCIVHTYKVEDLTNGERFEQKAGCGDDQLVWVCRALFVTCNFWQLLFAEIAKLSSFVGILAIQGYEWCYSSKCVADNVLEWPKICSSVLTMTCILVTIHTARLRHSRIYFAELHLNPHLWPGDVQFVSNIPPFSAAWCTKCVLPCLSIFIRLFWSSNPTHQITRYCKTNGSHRIPNLICEEYWWQTRRQSFPVNDD